MPTSQTPWGPGFLPEAGLLSCTGPQLRLESPGPRFWNSQSLSPIPSGLLHLAFCPILKLSLSKVKYIASPNPHLLLYLPSQLRTPHPLTLENLKPFYTLLHDPQPDPHGPHIPHVQDPHPFSRPQAEPLEGHQGSAILRAPTVAHWFIFFTK